MGTDQQQSATPADLQQQVDDRIFHKPQPFGDYVLLGRIARGGMAEVYFAAPKGGAADILALKCMRPNLVEEERFVGMFVREGRLAMMLDHPHIVRSLDVGDVGNRSFIVMEYISGQDLTAVLRRCQQASRRVPVPHGIFIALSICRALHYAHDLSTPQGRSLNIVNRDVSPSNVRMTYDGGVKLIDFGIAQAVMQVTSEIGVLKGKFAYMSPEQIRGLPLDRRTDVFSLGIVLHEVLTCERLFRDDSEFALMEKVRQTAIKPPSAQNSRVPKQLDDVVMRALERDAGSRYQTTAAMADDLEGLLEGYAFDPAELGEFVRSLYPADYRKDQDLLRRLAGQPASKPARRTRPKKPARRRRDSAAAAPRPARADRGNQPLIWIAVVLLILGIAVMVLALR